MLESKLVERMGEWLQDQGYDVKNSVYVGGKGYKEIDILAKRKNTKIGIEVKTLNCPHDFFVGMAQCFHFSPYTNSMYMAVPSGSISERHVRICRSAGIGLFSIGNSIEILVDAEKNSVERDIAMSRYLSTRYYYFTKQGELLYSLIKMAALSLEQNPIKITTGEFGVLIGASQQTASRRFLAMQRKGLVRKIAGGDKSSHYRSSFIITEKGLKVLGKLEIELSNILRKLKSRV